MMLLYSRSILLSTATTAIITISLLQLQSASAAIIPNTYKLIEEDVLSNTYPTQPSEILPIQPILVYPKMREFRYEGRSSKLHQNNDIIYVQLVKRKSYRPRKVSNNIDDDDDNDNDGGKELTMKDIFYVKALANGQFSHNRLKVYRLPEFYAISVYHKGEQMPKFR